VIAGLFAFTIREFALAAPAAVLVATLIARPRSRGPWVLAIGYVAFLAAWYIWRTGLTNTNGATRPNPLAAQYALLAIASLGLGLLPVAIAARLHPSSRVPDFFVGSVLTAVLLLPGAVITTQAGFPLTTLGNLFAPTGTPSAMYGDRPLLVSKEVWGLFSVAAVVGATLVGGHLAAAVGRLSREALSTRRLPMPPIHVWPVVIYCAMLACGLILFLTTSIVFDRYLWPLLLPLSILLLRDGAAGPDARRTTRRLAVIGASTVFLATSSIIVLNAFAIDVARWRAGE
jgi:hypothetical protein